MPAVRITPVEAHEKVKTGQVILVCGYENEEKFKALRFEMAVSLACKVTGFRHDVFATQESVFRSKY